MSVARRGANNGRASGAVNAATAVQTACGMVLAAPAVHPYVKLGCIGVAITAELVKWWLETANRRTIRCRFIEGVPEPGGVMYRQEVSHYSKKPYQFSFRHPTETITAISCLPLDDETVQSPEAEVIDGGIYYGFVTICLTPVEEGEWGCKIAICAKPGTPKLTIEDSCARPAIGAADSTQTTAAAAPAVTAVVTSAVNPPWLVSLVVAMVVMFVVVMILMIVIIVRGEMWRGDRWLSDYHLTSL